MATNFLEQLVAEWYEYQGYFIRRNVWVGKRPQGGYECELDIVAFHPGKKHLVQIEPSMDAASWAERERRYKKKFAAGRKYIPELFKGLEIPTSIEQIALLVFASRQNRETLAGGKLIVENELLADIFSDLKSRSIVELGKNKSKIIEKKMEEKRVEFGTTSSLKKYEFLTPCKGGRSCRNCLIFFEAVCERFYRRHG